MESNILLESGTNELEVLEFMVGEQSFGINIAKVTEIMNYQPMVPVPDSHPAFEGVFTPRDKVISVINLHTILHKESPDPLSHHTFAQLPVHNRNWSDNTDISLTSWEKYISDRI